MKKILALLLTVLLLLTAASAEGMRVGSLKGPTTIGLVSLMDAAEAGIAVGDYTFSIETQANVLISGMVSGDYDVVLVPANAAALLYKKSGAAVSVIDINTLGVLYCVTGDQSIHSVADLAGKTVLTTGQGTTPEYSLRYLLAANGVADCTLEFRSEATEIAAVLAQDANTIAVLPQPFVTVATTKTPAVQVAFSLSAEWDAVSADSAMVTGVTVVRKAYLEAHPSEVACFMAEHAVSAAAVNADPAAAAELVVKYGIIENAKIAEKAIPACSVVCISGEEMKAKLTGYLTVLFGQDPASVGGAVPDEDFFYVP